MVGAVIGNYQLVRKLGEGGMGVVYLGQHTLLGRRAAVKVLLPAFSARPDIVNRFFNEARAVTSISDPGIVQVFDFGYHTDGSAFIVMEFLDGEALDRRLARMGRLPVGEVLRLGRQLASSLAAAHAQHIVHRDLKPENIFLVPDAEVVSGERSKILDFGIAKLSDDHPGKMKTNTGVLMGTPIYMSPEQCRGLVDIDHRSDIYALGCVLFHLLTGRPPFDGEGPGDIISAHIREPAVPPSSRMPDIPPQVDALVMRCLAKAPADRFQGMTEVAAVLGQLLQLVPTGAPGGVPAYAPPVYHALPTTRTVTGEPTGPTTLGGSAGQLSGLQRRRSRSGVWIAAVLVIGAAAAGIAIVARGGGSTAPSVATETGPVAAAPPGVTAPGAAPAKLAEPASAPGPAAAAANPAPQTANRPPSGATDAPAPGSTTTDTPGKAAVAAAEPPAPGATTPGTHGKSAAAAADAPAPGSATTAAPNEPAKAPAGAETPSTTTRGSSSEPRDRKRKPTTAGSSSGEPRAHSTKAGQTSAAPGTAGASKTAPDVSAAPTSAAAGSAAAAPPKPGPGAGSAPSSPAPSAAPSAPGTAARGSGEAGGNAALKCSKASFAAVYDAAEPAQAAVRAALRNLKACRDAGAITDAEFDRYQTALVSKL